MEVEVEVEALIQTLLSESTVEPETEEVEETAYQTMVSVKEETAEKETLLSRADSAPSEVEVVEVVPPIMQVRLVLLAELVVVGLVVWEVSLI